MSMADETKAAIERRLTAAVREADQAFTTSGGSSRHWVHECFLPSLEKARLAIVDALVPTHLEGYRRDCESLAKKLDAAERRAEKAELDYRGVVENFDLDSLNKSIADAKRRVEQLKNVLEIIRDADEDCKRDGLPRMPGIVRKMVDEAMR